MNSTPLRFRQIHRDCHEGLEVPEVGGSQVLAGKVTCAPEGAPLEFVHRNGRVDFVLARLEGHQMVVLDLG